LERKEHEQKIAWKKTKGRGEIVDCVNLAPLRRRPRGIITMQKDCGLVWGLGKGGNKCEQRGKCRDSDERRELARGRRTDVIEGENR